MSAKLSFTPQSAIARDTQRGAAGPRPKIGKTSPAQETSFAGSIKLRLAEKAIVKKSTVSTVLPISVDASGARHHFPARNVEQDRSDRRGAFEILRFSSTVESNAAS